MRPPAKIVPDQHELTPEQNTYLAWYIEERLRAQLAPGPVDEAVALRHLRCAYVAAGLQPPNHVYWLDSPLAFVDCFLTREKEVGPDALPFVWDGVQVTVDDRLQATVATSVQEQVRVQVRAQVWGDTLTGARVARVGNSIATGMWDNVRDRASNARDAGDAGGVEDTQADLVWAPLRNRVNAAGSAARGAVWDAVRAYDAAHSLISYRFFDEFSHPNALYALTHFVELVAGYVLGTRRALVARKPLVLERDEQGQLHSAQGKCIVFADGWGFYAWHGVPVFERVILEPASLTKQDWSRARNVEVRRVIQDRMGDRFVEEMGGRCLHHGTYGDLYDVDLPGDPEQVARYVKVQDSSTPRQYYLRVPPSMTNADAAIAWTFELPHEDYAPVQQA